MKQQSKEQALALGLNSRKNSQKTIKCKKRIINLLFVSCIFLSILFFASCSQTSQIPVIIPHIKYNSIGINHILTIKGDFSQPRGIAVDSKGEVYLADAGKNIVYILNKEGKIIDTIGRFGWKEGEFDQPTDIAVDSNLRLYIADSGNDRIQKYSLISQDFKIIAGDKSEETDSELKLYEPQGIAIDSTGYIYIADTWNNRLLKIDPLGRPQLKIGNFGTLKEPHGIMVDNVKNIYVCDTGNHRICKFDFTGVQTAIFGEEGSDKGKFRNPIGISSDKYGNVYVVDQGNQRIQVLKYDGAYLMEFGQQHLQSPYGISISNDNYIYITDALSADIEVFKIVASE